MIFVVRNDQRASDYLFQSSVTTFQAYNNWPGHVAGLPENGKSAYEFSSYPLQSFQTATPPGVSTWVGQRAVKVSFNRPYGMTPASATDQNAPAPHGAGVNPDGAAGIGAGEYLTNEQFSGSTLINGWEYNMVRFLEREGYDVTYATSIDTHERDVTVNRKAYLSVGHDEYWSRPMRENIASARNRGVNLGFFSSNTAFHQVRFEADRQGSADRVMVVYKGGADLAGQLDPQAAAFPDAWVPIMFPEDSLMGVRSNPAVPFAPVAGPPLYSADVVVQDVSSWVFAGTGLNSGAHLANLLGCEADSLLLTNLSAVTHIARESLSFLGPVTADSVAYQLRSGSNVVAIGSMQWSWGLDDFDSTGKRGSFVNASAQQMTRNILARLKTTSPRKLTKFDADGDGTADLQLWQDASASFYTLQSGTGVVRADPFGASGHKNVPMSADYDGDGKADISLWQDASASFYILQSSNGVTRTVPFGAAGHNDVPVPADYDGDGKADIALWQDASASFYILQSSNGLTRTVPFGSPGHNNVPVPADYDGDGKADVALWQDASASFYILQSSNGVTRTVPFGAAGHSDVPVPADYDGDGKADIALWQDASASFYILQSSNGVTRTVPFGAAGFNDVPVPADYDGDGKADVALWQDAASSLFVLETTDGKTVTTAFGSPGLGNVPTVEAPVFRMPP